MEEALNALLQAIITRRCLRMGVFASRSPLRLALATPCRAL